MISSVLNKINPAHTAIATTAFATATYLTSQTNIFAKKVFCHIKMSPIMLNDGKTFGCMLKEIKPDVEVCRNIYNSNEFQNSIDMNDCLSKSYYVDKIFSAGDQPSGCLFPNLLFWGTVCLFTLTAVTLAYRKFRVQTVDLKAD